MVLLLCSTYEAVTGCNDGCCGAVKAMAAVMNGVAAVDLCSGDCCDYG